MKLALALAIAFASLTSSFAMACGMSSNFAINDINTTIKATAGSTTSVTGHQ